MYRFSPFLLLALVAGCSGGGSIPDALSAIEGDAEHAYDVALVEDYTQLAETAGTIDAAWTDFRPTAEADGASGTVLAGVDDAIAALVDSAGLEEGAAASGRAANGVSEFMPQLYDLYAPAVPSEVLALDYLGREVVLDGMDGDFTAAGSDVETLASTWESVRQAVLDAGGDAEATDFDASVELLRSLAAGDDAQALIDEANVNLELVDVLEGVF